MEIEKFKEFVESLHGRLWVAKDRGIIRAYFGDGYRTAYVEAELESDHSIDLIEGSRIDASIKARSIPNGNWLASQKRLAIEDHRAKLLAVTAFLQIEDHANGVAVDQATHTEELIQVTDDLAVALTDVATVGGIPTGRDGVFLIRDGRIWVPSADTPEDRDDDHMTCRM